MMPAIENSTGISLKSCQAELAETDTDLTL